jgi:uncharacterized protein YecT (DUF1311 family)
MARRAHIDEILEWKERRGRSRLGGEILHKIDDLAHSWRRIDSDDKGFNDFVPMRLVTIIEVYLRETIREVVDASQVYLDRAEPLLKSAKLDFLAAKHLHGQRLTMGDIVAHSVTVTDLDHVISIYETLLPGYRVALPTVHERWIEERDQQPKHPILYDVDRVLATVRRIFEIRHIVTHEMPHKPPYLPEEITGFLDSSRDFLLATDWFLTGQLRGDVPKTQITMNISAGEALDQETKSMEQLLNQFQSKAEDDLELLRTSQNAWERYANAEADLLASQGAGGSMYSMVWANYKLELTQARIKDLRWWLEKEPECLTRS